MFDFRYHALSLVAVFVALLVGLLLGVAVGDAGLVSNAENGLRRDLESDVEKAREDTRGLRDSIAQQNRYQEATFRPLVAERLDGRRVALLFLDGRNEAVFERVRDSVVAAGGRLSFTATLRTPLDLDSIEQDAGGTQYESIGTDLGLLGDLGRRTGIQLVRGGRLVRELSDSLFASRSGELGPVEAVVVVRAPGDRLEEASRRQVDSFVSGLLDGIETVDAPVVGVEETTTDPSQVPWYTDRGLASVDNVDQVPGRASLVYALAGSADGAYGVKATRDAFIPDALVRGP